MIEYKPPVRPDYLDSTKFTIFLGGSIDMGRAENWQERLATDLSDYDSDLILLNPRRTDWDPTWPQDPTPGTNFNLQVSWEFLYQDQSDLNLYYFGDDSAAPISFLELGSYGTDSPKDTVVRCSPKFYRYGNVHLFCEKHGITLTHTYEECLTELRKRIDKEFYDV